MRSDPEFDRFFCQHYPGVVRSLTVITGNGEVAADCTQEAFIRAYARWGRVSRYASPSAWVRRVAINLANDHFRSSGRRRRREDHFHAGRALVEAPASAEVDADLALGTMMASLSPQQRSVAALFYVEDLPILEIAGTLDLSVGTVKFHLHQARAALRQTLEAAEADHA